IDSLWPPPGPHALASSADWYSGRKPLPAWKVPGRLVSVVSEGSDGVIEPEVEAAWVGSDDTLIDDSKVASDIPPAVSVATGIGITSVTGSGLGSTSSTADAASPM